MTHRAHRVFDDGHPGPLIISHDGLTDRGDAPGSSDAYRRAYLLGYRYFQTDVMLTADDVLVSAHSIAGRFLGTAPTLDELLRRKPETATLEDLLGDDELGDARWNIEIKSIQSLDALVRLLTGRPKAIERCFVSSPFRPKILRTLRRELPGLATCASLVQGGLVGVPLYPKAPRHDAVQIGKWAGVPAWVVRWNHRRGIHVQVWGVTADEVDDLSARGVDAVVTDDLRELADREPQHAAGPSGPGRPEP